MLVKWNLLILHYVLISYKLKWAIISCEKLQIISKGELSWAILWNIYLKSMEIILYKSFTSKY